MKKNIFFAAFAIAGVIAYFLQKKKTPQVQRSLEPENVKKHHVTKVFSKAKQVAVH